ncbi:FAD-dependent monooxygenase [Marinomonas ostreistagni]|uniref:FAD-dependent monooxygenase n=1 Tax=Marinomonas ostreistagni TaxID=359209 RepID=UPI00194F1AA2|nr:FAD-dependent monooxygenase [Marinomonas ostreistagni]
MSNSDQVSQVIVVGAGIGGLTLAIALARQGYQVRIFEQADALSEVGAGLQLSPNAVKVLRTLGLEHVLKDYVYQPENAAIRHYQSGRYFLKSELGLQAEQRYGAPYWHIHRADLHGVLVQACYSAGVEIELGHKVLGYRSDKKKATVLLENKTEYCDLVVGADGIHSKVRELMLGIQAPIFTGQVAWRGVIRADQIKGVELKPDATVWAGPNQHMVTYYLRGGEFVNFVAVEERAEWSNESWRQEGKVSELQSKFAGWHPEVTRMLDACDATFMWALNGRPTLPKWSDQRVVLLGDACHPMLPFMAQGAAMAIEDAYVLSQLLSKHDYPTAFTQYETIRKPRTSAIQKLSRENAGLYHMHGGMLGQAKLEALGVVSKFAGGLIKGKLDSVYGYDVTSLSM